MNYLMNEMPDLSERSFGEMFVRLKIVQHLPSGVIFYSGNELNLSEDVLYIPQKVGDFLEISFSEGCPRWCNDYDKCSHCKNARWYHWS